MLTRILSDDLPVFEGALVKTLHKLCRGGEGEGDKNLHPQAPGH